MSRGVLPYQCANSGSRYYITIEEWTARTKRCPLCGRTLKFLGKGLGSAVALPRHNRLTEIFTTKGIK